MRSRFTICALAGALAFALAPAVASAGTITFTLTPDKDTGDPTTSAIQQSTQDPCIFGNPPCGQNNDVIGDGSGNPFPWERTPLSSEEPPSPSLTVGDLADSTAWGNGSGEVNDYDATRILVSRLITVLNSTSLEIGIDVNQTGSAFTYSLDSFVMNVFSSTGTLIDTWTLTGTPKLITEGNNGTGWSDAILRFPGLNLASYPAGAYVTFTTDWSGNTDGADNYFLNSTIAGPPNIPEPASLVLLGSGLVGAAGALRRRRAARKA